MIHIYEQKEIELFIGKFSNFITGPIVTILIIEKSLLQSKKLKKA